MLRNDTETKYFGMIFVAGHGMSKEGTQWILLNKFQPKTGFYHLYSTESEIRKWSKWYLNCYFAAVFACCREIYDLSKHCNCISANSYDEAEKIFIAEDKEKERKMLEQSSIEEENKRLK